MSGVGLCCKDRRCLSTYYSAVVDIQSMAVHPDFQRRGIAKALVDRALAEVDKAGHECYLESTMVGQALYRRCGFQAAADIPIESVEYTFQAMIRPSSKTMVDNKGIVG